METGHRLAGTQASAYPLEELRRRYGRRVETWNVGVRGGPLGQRAGQQATARAARQGDRRLDQQLHLGVHHAGQHATLGHGHGHARAVGGVPLKWPSPQRAAKDTALPNSQ